jgi:hypothetical protein
MAHAHATADCFFPWHRRLGLGHELRSGARAGVAAGLAMAVALMGLSVTLLGRSPFYPLRVIAASVTGTGALGSVSPDTVLLGALVHLVGPALIWGVVFGLIVWTFRPERSVGLAWLGLVVGAAAQVVDVNVLIPALSHSATLANVIPFHVNDIWADRIPITVSWIAHLVFGLALSLHPWRFNPGAGTFD